MGQERQSKAISAAEGGRPFQSKDRRAPHGKLPIRPASPAMRPQLVATADRQAVGYLPQMPQHIDVVIPRGERD